MGVFFINRRWTKEQIQILIEKYSYASWEELEKLLYPFTKNDIVQKASKLNLKRQNYYWTQEEIDYLKENYYIKSKKELSQILKRKSHAIVKKAYELGISKSNKWNKEELDFLINNYATIDNKEISKILNRKIHSIIDKACELNLKKEITNKKYNPEEFLNNVFELAKSLGRTPFVSEVVKQEWSMSVMSINRYFGGYKNVCELLGLEINNNIFGSKIPTYRSLNSDLCWSKSEVIVTNFFINNNIKYIKEVPYSNLCSDDRLKNKIADWVINDNVVVEFFGMMDKDFYNSKAQNKIMLCKENNINLIYLTEKDLINLYKIFEDFIPN